MSVTKVTFIFCTFFVIIFSNVAPGIAQGPVIQGPPSSATPAFVAGEIIVRFQPNVGRLGAQSSLRAEGLRLLEVSAQGNLLRVQVTPGQEAQAMAELLARGDVEFAAYNHILEALITPNDPSYGSQWALPKIEAPAAWDFFTGSNNVTVGIVDSGLDTSHSEFSGRIVFPRDEIEHDSVPQDLCGHGTHVTGIIGAKGNNGSGIAGMSWGVNLLPVRVMTPGISPCGGNESDIYDGIYWAVNHGAKIINLSLGGAPASGKSCEQTYPVMSSAVQYALDQGVLVVAASGNVGTSTVYCPAAMNGVMAVGGTGATDVRSSFSNYGAQLDIAAPGSSILSTVPGGYDYMSGTSMATPHVAGLAALIWSLAPGLSNNQVRDIIQNTADDLGALGWDQYYGYGRINARRALTTIALQPSPAQPFLLVGDNLPSTSSVVRIVTSSSENINWTATISPTVPWLDLSPPAMGTVSAASTDQYIVLNAQRPAAPPNYGVYPATLVLTGTTASGTIGPISTEVKVQYVEKVHIYYMPLFFKN